MTSPISYARPMDTEYRSIISDNRRWSGFVSRPGDIFVCTPPKCGTTWTQMIVRSLLFPDGNSPGPVTEIAPWIEARFNPIDDVIARLAAQTHRRSIKSHTPADGIPWFEDASYIVVGRDGKDAFMSFLNHMRSMREENLSMLAGTAAEDGIEMGAFPPLDDVHAFFAYWLEGADWFRHLGSFWARREQANVMFVHFNDLKADLEGQMRSIAEFLGIEISEVLWPEVVERCTFAAMKANASDIADFDLMFQGGADAFLFKGTNGRWRDVLTDDEIAAFDRRCVELLAPDAIAWLAGQSPPSN